MKNHSSFTLIEIIMVVALIAVLTGIAIGGYSYAMGASREAATRATLKQLETALENAKAKYGFYPAVYEKTGSGKKIIMQTAEFSKESGTADLPVIQLFGEGGETISDGDLATKWKKESSVKPLPSEYIKVFRQTLDMESLRQYIDAKGLVCDAWGTPIIYQSPGEKKKPFSFRSCGPDGIYDNADDITNWD